MSDNLPAGVAGGTRGNAGTTAAEAVHVGGERLPAEADVDVGEGPFVYNIKNLIFFLLLFRQFSRNY